MSNSPISSNGIDSKDESWLLLLSDPSAEKAKMRSKLVFFSCCTLMTMIPAIAALVLYPLGQVFAALISLILAGAGLAGGFCLYLNRMLRPTHHIATAIERFRRGDSAVRCPEKAPGLLGLLGDAAREDRGDQAVPPVVGDAAEKALLLGLGCAAGAALVPAGARPHERAQTRLLGSPALPARSCHAPTILSRPLGPSFSRPLIIYRGHCIAPRVRGPAPGRIVYVAFRLCGCSVGLTPNVGWLAKVVLHAATCGTRASPSAGPAGA